MRVKNRRVRRDWSPLVQAALLPLAFVVGVGSFVLVANGKQKSAKVPEGPPPSILMVGDSLSVGKFGEVVQRHLSRKYPVAAYASCGSSPEHWLTAEPDFITKCGYRQHTIDSDVFRDFTNGKPPRPTLTPKLTKLLKKHRPTILIVQLGTNWMDRSLTDAQMNDYLHRFVGEARRGSVQEIIWITPPDSSALRKTQGRVHGLIQQAARRDGFQLVDSRGVTRYVVGKTGGDGVHYNSEASEAWARRIQGDLDSKLSRSARDRKFSPLKRES
ncbi:MAG TPA: SGNH/GDSL hydrolase family protein [Chthoniobacterales bacterium]|nr:SGNH/GDSL hydrolase family protein [Chthoniobacterales bacterium]